MRIKLLDARGKLPVAQNPGADCGYDLTAIEDTILSANVPTKVRTGIAIQFDDYWGGVIADRSSLAAKGVVVSGGVIDNGYRGEIMVLMTYHCSDFGTTFKHYDIKAGDRIAQLIPQKIYTYITPMIVKELSDTKRATGGFGSTGK